MAWRYVTHLNQQDAVAQLCYELPTTKLASGNGFDVENRDAQTNVMNLGADERLPLLDGVAQSATAFDEEEQDEATTSASGAAEDFAYTLAGLNALQIAAIAGAKRFLSQKAVQRVIDGIWYGDIVFWNALNVHSTKRVQIYSNTRTDPYCRLRVPLYLKTFEALFFTLFLAFYYAVLIDKQSQDMPAAEVMLYIWLAAFAYNGALRTERLCWDRD